ncbi:hypothetical protein SAMN05443668_101856 [Cryptosporangium aurantiacum]|uniref:Uncharacterized protein n=1 Tax=Cryptosporangium aurantiacum TaxID=134849 RepID=A0A1M7JPD2_9ACTN|nr:hypothetical protein SAMN05443668_101856 [Cryptosporangium aurantiacum]
MSFTGTVARSEATEERCRCVALRVTFGLRGAAPAPRRARRLRGVFPAQSRDQWLAERLLAPVPHPARTL